jgi:drug/metabolite transporter (DMT)-like permease
MNNNRNAYIYALSAILLWSTVSISFKIALKYVNFLQLLFFSTAIAWMIHLSIAFISKKGHELFSVTRKEILYSAFVGFLNPFSYYVVLLKAYSILPAQLAQPLNYLWPAMLVLLSAPLLGQKLKVKSIAAVILGFLGVYVISTKGNIFNYNIDHPFGVLLAAGSSVIWALSWIYNQKDKRPEHIKLVWSFFFGLIYITLTIFVFSDFHIPVLNGILAILYVGFFEMGITFFLWLRALQLTDRNDRISNLVFLSPVLALFFIRIFLHESIFYTTVIGLFLIIAGIFINQYRMKT